MRRLLLGLALAAGLAGATPVHADDYVICVGIDGRDDIGYYCIWRPTDDR